MINKLIAPRKKLTPASITAQKAWAGFPVKLKKELKRTLPDFDKDGVPNGFDCKPKNRRRQESFLPADAAYLNLNPEIRLGKKVGEGTQGTVYQLANNRNLVVKVPIGYRPSWECPSPSVINADTRYRLRATGYTKGAIQEEALCYEKQGFNDKPLFIPTRIVNLGTNDLNNGEYTGLIRPKVEPVFDYHGSVKNVSKKRVTDAALKEMYKKIMKLTCEGYAFSDGFQVGIDRSGRLLLYDAGSMKKYAAGDDIPFEINDYNWLNFLYSLKKLEGYADSQIQRCYEKYGQIKKPENSSSKRYQ